MYVSETRMRELRTLYAEMMKLMYEYTISWQHIMVNGYSSDKALRNTFAVVMYALIFSLK